jgi:hypothetical protein
MKYLIYLFLLFSHIQLFSQQHFAPVGAKWYYTPHCNGVSNCEYFTFESVADTLVDGQVARKIIYTNHTPDVDEVIPDATLIMYGDSNKIYYHFEDEFHVLYDFSAEIGDTLNIKLGTFANYYQLGSGNLISNSQEIQVLVNSVGMTTINNENLRTLNYSFVLDNNPDAIWGNFNFGNGSIIERIGNTNAGLFGESLTQVLGGFTGNFRCYEDSSFTYSNPNYTFPCDYIFSTAIKELNEEQFQIFPNPVSNKLFIKKRSGNPNSYKVQIIDVKGIILNEVFHSINSNETIEIDTQNIKDGFYFLRIITNNSATIEKIKIER